MIKQQSFKQQKVIEAYNLSLHHRNSILSNLPHPSQQSTPIDQNTISVQKPTSQPKITPNTSITSITSILNSNKTIRNRSIDFPIFYSGVLLKKSTSSSWFPLWNKKYCVLDKFKFTYHETESKSSPEDGVLNFNAVSLSFFFQLNQKNQITFFTFIPHTLSKQFTFKSENPSLNYKWAKLLSQSTQNSQGYKNEFVSICLEPQFWKKDYELEDEFQRNAETGDILLFKGTKTISNLVRKFTFSDYDHVAVLLRNERGEIIVFEATGGVGVGIMPWRKFIEMGWYKSQHIISYRKLKINRTERFYSLVEEFVNINIGKTYDFSLSKMLKRVSVQEEQEGNIKREEKNSFFCSELVAALYKYLGILERTKSSTQYWPGSFEEDEDLHFVSTTEFGKPILGRETIIIFQQSQLKLSY